MIPQFLFNNGKYLSICLYIFCVLITKSFSQQKVNNISTIPIYKSTLLERQLIQRSIFGGPNLITGKFSGIIPEYKLANGMAYFKFDTYSAPKSVIYGNIMLYNSDLRKELNITDDFKKKYFRLKMKFWDSFKFSYATQQILSRNDYLTYTDSLESLVSPYYQSVNEKGKEIIENTERLISFISETNTQIKRNTKLDKLTSNKYWDGNFNLFDVYTDKPLKLFLGGNNEKYYSYYNIFILNDSDDVDSIINYYNSEINKGIKPKDINSNKIYYPKELLNINGIKFENIENFYNWAKLKYPEKFPKNNFEISSKNNQVKNSNTPKKESSEYKNLEAFATFMRSVKSPTNKVITKTNNSSNNSSNNLSYKLLTKQKKCNSCNGTGKCGKCSKTQQDGYYNNSGSYIRVSEIRLGMIICKVCHGSGIFMKKSSCDWCHSQGWEFCPDCNYNGKGNYVGKCRTCEGTGNSKY